MVLSRQLGGLYLAVAVSFVIACGAEPSPPLYSSPQPPSPLLFLSLNASSFLVEIEQSVTAVAHVTGTGTPVTWALNCESGAASLLPSGNSATVTAHGGGMCFLWAMEDGLSALAIVRIPPLAAGDSCTEDSQCGQGTPVCGATGPCGKTCTTLCVTDADCPVSAPSGDHVACSRNHLCRLVSEPDYSCP